MNSFFTYSISSSNKPFICWHTHWDRAWYASFEQYQHRLVQVLERILNALEADELPTFTLDGQTSLLADALALAPQLSPRLLEHLDAGRLHIGPWFTMPDTALVSLESLLRNLQHGMTEARALGINAFTGYLPDTFGQPESIPLLLQKCGIPHAMVWRGVALATAPDETPYFNWQSPGGQGVLTYALPEGYFQMPLQDAELEGFEARLEALKALEKRLNALNAPVFLPLGGDHLGPPSAEILTRFQLSQKGQYQHGHPHQYMAQLQAKINAGELPMGPTRRGPLRDWGADCAPLLSGTLLSRPWLKQKNAQCEWFLLQIWEPLRARHAEQLFEQGRGDETKSLLWEAEAAALHEAWTALLTNHAHDEICGCSVDVVHLQNEARAAQVLELAQTWTNWHRHELEMLLGEPAFLPVELPPDAFSPVALETLTPPDEAATANEAIETKTQLLDEWRYDITQVPLSHRTQTVYAYPAAKTPLDAPAQKQAMQRLKQLAERLKIETFEDAGDSYNAAPKVASRQVVTPRFQPKPATLSAEAKVKIEADTLTLRLKAIGQNASALEIVQQVATPHLQVNLVLEIGEGLPESEALQHTGFHPLAVEIPGPQARFQGYPATPEQVEWQPATQAYHGALRWPGGTLIFPGHYAFEVVDKHVILPLSRGFDQISGGRLPSRQVPAGPPFETPGGLGLGRVLQHRLRVVDAPLKMSQLMAHQHQLVMQPSYPVFPERKLRSVVDSLTLQSEALQVTAHQWNASTNQWQVRLLNAGDAALSVQLPQTCHWQRVDDFTQPLETLSPLNSLTIPPRDWVMLCYVLR